MESLGTREREGRREKVIERDAEREKEIERG